MGDENDGSMEIELEYEDKEVIEINDDEDELEEFEEVKPPSLSCWLGADGKVHHEIVVNINDDLYGLKNKLQMIEPCSICYLPFASQGNHRICCLPCGHLYGFSCIKKWLQTSSGWKCPQCNALCAYKDVILLYASQANAHQKISSTRHFPFTKQGLIEFEEHERLRCVDTMKMHTEERKRLFDVLEHRYDVTNQRLTLSTQLNGLSKRAQELEQDDALRRQALRRRYNALGRRAAVFEQRLSVLERRLSAYGPTLKFFTRMYKEHLALLKNTKPFAAARLHLPVTSTNLSVDHHYYHASMLW